MTGACKKLVLALVKPAERCLHVEVLCLPNAGAVCGKFEFHDRRESFAVTF